MDRRAFLAGSLVGLIAAREGDAAPAPSDAENPRLSFFDHALLADIEAVDVVIIRRPVKEELASGDGLRLALQRYDRDGFSRSCAPPVILSTAQIRTGFYLRGSVSFKLRVGVDDNEPEGRGLVLRVVLRECARVRVYTETADGRVGASGQPIWVDQIVVVTGPLEGAPA